MARKIKQGPEVFDKWFLEQWSDRWESLRAALMEPVSHVAWWNPWTVSKPETLLPQATPSIDLPGFYEASEFAPPPRDESGLLPFYLMDGASAMISRVWNPESGEAFLDLCAAPGGKTLQLAARLEKGQTLTANELSKPRFHRLQRVLADYIPQSILEHRVRVTRFDAKKWCLYEQNAYQWILLDAPCSSERHLLHMPKEMASWSPARSRQLAQRQYTMLVSALDVVLPEGCILYATCSISPLECDGVLQKLQKKRRGRFKFIPLKLPKSEPTEFGSYFLPDSSQWGPLFLALIQKTH